MSRVAAARKQEGVEFMIIFFLVSLLASVAGAICGIGGGVVIKPVLDMLGLETVSAISFLSGCTVLSMSCYSVPRALTKGDSGVDVRTGTPLAIGAALGGLVGKQLFELVKSLSAQSVVGAVQAGCLGVITLGTLAYTLNKSRIPTHRVTAPGVCAAIGLGLGIMSSFLGIGGGPINLVVLYYFFSMDTKTAASNSLYIILFSQLASLLTTLLTHTVPPFRWSVLLVMVGGGVGGGVVGRALNKRMDNRLVERLFIALMGVIVLICLYNVWRGLRG